MHYDTFFRVFTHFPIGKFSFFAEKVRKTPSKCNNHYRPKLWYRPLPTPLGIENRKLLVRSPARPIFFLRIDDGHWNRIHSPLTAVCCFDNGYLRKQPVAWNEYCAEYWLKDLQESMDRCTGRRNITEILLKTVLDTIQSINKWKEGTYWRTARSKSMGECNTILSAYTKYRHLGYCCTRPPKYSYQYLIAVNYLPHYRIRLWNDIEQITPHNYY